MATSPSRRAPACSPARSMSVDEGARYRLHRKLEALLGRAEAATLMTLLSESDRSRRSVALGPVGPGRRAEPDLHAHTERITRELIIWMGCVLAVATAIGFLAGRLL